MTVLGVDFAEKTTIPISIAIPRIGNAHFETYTATIGKVNSNFKINPFQICYRNINVTCETGDIWRK